MKLRGTLILIIKLTRLKATFLMLRLCWSSRKTKVTVMLNEYVANPIAAKPLMGFSSLRFHMRLNTLSIN